RLAGNIARRCQGAGGEVRRGAQGGGDLEAAKYRRGGRRNRREAVEADGPFERTRRRSERLCQFRGFRRARGQDGRITSFPPRIMRYKCPCPRSRFAPLSASSASTPACAAPVGA